MGNIPVIGITGSCGKTSATNFLGKILQDQGRTFVGIDSNGGSWMHKNLRRLNGSYSYLLQEIAAAKQGDIRASTQVMQPSVGIVTTIGQDHFTAFRTYEATAREKRALVELLPQDGVAVLNADDPYVLAMTEASPARVLTYGTGQDADVRISEVRGNWPELLSMDVTYGGETVTIGTGLFGDLLALSLSAAVAGALAVGIPLRQCASSLNGIRAYDRRMSIHRSPEGVYFINDCKKAPYWSVLPAVSQMKDAEAPRKTIVLGSFSDVPGSVSGKYRAMARTLMEFVDRVVFVGKSAYYLRKLNGPEYQGRVYGFENMVEACDFLRNDVIANELIYAKSSKNEHLERVVYSQIYDMSCYKNLCSEEVSCHLCKKNGCTPLGSA